MMRQIPRGRPRDGGSPEPPMDGSTEWSLVDGDGGIIAPILDAAAAHTSGFEDPVLDGPTAAAALEALIARKAKREEPDFFDHERRLLDVYFACGYSTNDFKTRYLAVVRDVLRKGSFALARLLIQADTTNSMLSGQPDIVQRAIAANLAEKPTMEMLEFLSSKGALAQEPDAEGNTQLYYACLLGKAELFKVLVDSGADFHTLHDDVKDKNRRSDKDAPTTNPVRSRKVSLLDIAMDSNLYDRAIYLHDTPRVRDTRNWGPIIEALADAGLPFDRKNMHPMMVRRLQVACYLNDTEVVSRILREEDRPAVGEQTFLAKFVLPAALCAAVEGGHKELLLWLLDYGTDPRAHYPLDENIPKPFTFDHIFRVRRSQSTFSKALFYFTNGWPHDHNWASVAECLAVLAVHIGQTAENRNDFQKLLDKSIERGFSTVVKKLISELGMTLRGKSVPVCEDIATLELVLEQGGEWDFETYLMHIIYKVSAEKSLPLLGFIVFHSRTGSWRENNQLMRYVSSALLKPNLAQFLLRYFDLDVNTYYQPYTANPNYRPRYENLLAIAIVERKSPEAVRMLLDFGADKSLPGVDFDARGAVQRAMQGTYQTVAVLWKTYLPIIQALENNRVPMPEEWLPPPPSPPSPSKLDIQMNLILESKSSKRRQNSIQFSGFSSEANEQATRGGGPQTTLAIRIEAAPAELVDFPTWTIPRDTPNVLVDAEGSPYPYSPFTFPDSIRLIELQPSASERADLQARLVHSSISLGKPYEILSGYWGQGSKRDPVDLGDGKAWFVTSELASALRTVRQEREIRLLWVQSIGINPHNADERNHQIGMLRDIHISAQRHLVWLGEEAEDSHLIFRFLEENEGKLSEWMEERQPNRMGGSRLIWTRGYPDPPPGLDYDTPAARAYERFCQRPWFYRVWTDTELVLCKSITLFCGGDSAIWVAGDPNNIFQKLDRGYWAYKPKDETYRSWFENKDVVNGPEHIRQLANLLGTEDSFTYGGWDWGRIARSHLYRAHDERDIAYATAAWSPQRLIEVDYRKSLAEVFTDMMTAVVDGTTRELTFMETCSFRKSVPGLPSWVPDFIHRDTMVANRADGNTAFDQFKGLSIPAPRVEGKRLIIQGIWLETISAIGEAVTDDERVPGHPGIKPIFASWEAVAAALPSDKKRFQQSVFDALQNCLVAQRYRHDDPNGISGHCIAFKRWYSAYSTTSLLQKHDPEYFPKIETGEAWAAAARVRRYGGIPATLSAWQQPDALMAKYDEELRHTCYHRRFFVSAEGNMGLAPDGARAGDKLVWLTEAAFGFHYPFPFALRENGDGTYTLIGSCHVYVWDPHKRFAKGEVEFGEYVLV